MFKLNDVEFEIEQEPKKSCFWTGRENGFVQYSVDISAIQRDFCDEKVSPSLEISWIETEQTSIQSLVGMEFSISNIEEADEREDTFYLYEHEPFVAYYLKVAAIENNKARISLKEMHQKSLKIPCIPFMSTGPKKRR
ncbi:hypothetical protein FACS1894191_0890 [Clostridia bacterium]|nr:hypothetical protein FACS1894191_0890 [Clostridia bacterium]